jgi:hypothetical protein
MELVPIKGKNAGHTKARRNGTSILISNVANAATWTQKSTINHRTI